MAGGAVEVALIGERYEAVDRARSLGIVQRQTDVARRRGHAVAQRLVAGGDVVGARGSVLLGRRLRRSGIGAVHRLGQRLGASRCDDRIGGCRRRRFLRGARIVVTARHHEHDRDDGHDRDDAENGTDDRQLLTTPRSLGAAYELAFELSFGSLAPLLVAGQFVFLPLVEKRPRPLAARTDRVVTGRESANASLPLLPESMLGGPDASGHTKLARYFGLSL